MRTLVLAASMLGILAGCIHLPPEVAAVVRETDPPGHNNFLPERPSAQAADSDKPDAP